MASKRGIQHLRELQILSIVQEYSIGVRAGILAIALGAASIATSAALLAQSPVSSNAHPVVDDSLAGRSGKLKARIVTPRRGTGIRILRELFGDSAGDRPGRSEEHTSELQSPC